MNNMFYIVKRKEDWYILCEKRYKIVISTSDTLEGVLDSLAKIIKRYNGSKDTFYRRLSRGSHYVKEKSQSEREIAEREYEEWGDTYSDLIQEIVEEEVKLARENTPLNKFKKLAGKIKIKPLVEESKKEESEEEEEEVSAPKININIKLLKL